MNKLDELKSQIESFLALDAKVNKGFNMEATLLLRNAQMRNSADFARKLLVAINAIEKCKSKLETGSTITARSILDEALEKIGSKQE